MLFVCLELALHFSLRKAKKIDKKVFHLLLNNAYPGINTLV